MDRINRAMMQVGQPGFVGKLRDEQISQASDWDGFTNGGARREAAMHIIHVVPANGSTCTFVAPLDPFGDDGWRNPPSSAAPVARRGWYQ